MNNDEEVSADIDSCSNCSESSSSIDFAFAFQPLVSLKNKCIVGYEALARGPNGEPAITVLDQVHRDNQFRIDQDCRARAIRSAAALGLNAKLSINFIPNAIANPRRCIQRTVETARACGFDLTKLVLELTEGERVDDPDLLAATFREYRRLGIKTALDDFGAGYAGLNLLARFQPDYLKIDMALVRDVDSKRVNQVIVRGIVKICRELDICVLAEGVESARERDFLRDAGIDLMQGYFFARPTFQSLGGVSNDALHI